MLPIEMLSSKIYNSQSRSEFHQILLPIIDIFKNDVMADVAARMEMGTLYVCGSNEQFDEGNELMLRLRYPDNYIVVARIQFIHQRCGHMSKLENALLEIAKKHNYKGIRIECANSDKIQKYCTKHGYVEKQYTYGDYNLDL